MGKFEFTAEVTRLVDDTITLTVSADSLEDAEEKADKILNGVPGTNADRYLVQTRYFHPPEAINLRRKYYDANA